MRIYHHTLELQTGEGICLLDLTPALQERLDESRLRHGFVAVSSRHTTTAITINENEARLLEDVRDVLQRLVPPEAAYKHNDIHLRECPPDEPQNAHSHVCAMLLGSSECVPVSEGRLGLGRWQSLLLVELDGPRRRSVSVMLVGE